jgi:AraC-like DNA-binding protein
MQHGARDRIKGGQSGISPRRKRRAAEGTCQAQKKRKNRVGAAILPWHHEHTNDYERIALVIHYLDERHTHQPDPAGLAEYVGLSPFHFHRLCSAWAAITPEDFLQCLLLAHAKELLSKGDSVMDVALMSGLSGPGRLHDLCLMAKDEPPSLRK